MSKVISFRLDPDNPREAEALNVLQDWLSQGFSSRYTITNALLMLPPANSQTVENLALKDLSDQIMELLKKVEQGLLPVIPKENALSNEILSDEFVTSVIQTAKTGLRNET